MLSIKQKKILKSLAHNIKICVRIGKLGVNLNIKKEIDIQLLNHELIKIKILESCPSSFRELENTFKKYNYNIVNRIGKIFILYVPNPNPNSKKIFFPR